MAKSAKIRLQVAVVIQERDGVYFARCPFLNVLTHADSPDRAFENLQEEIEFLFEAALRDGSLVHLLDRRTSQPRELHFPRDFVQLEIRTTEFDLPEPVPEYLLKRFADAPEIPA